MARLRRRVAPVAALCAGLMLCVGGCGDDTTTTQDAAVDAETIGDGGPSFDPRIPWLEGEPHAAPVFTCPEGWREVVSATGTQTCDPWPEGGAHECDDGFAHFPGEPECERLGPECPADGLVADLPADRPAVHLLASAAPGGDGTRASPFTTLEEVDWDGLATGTVVALGRGTYDGVLRLRDDMTLQGACVTESILTNSVTAFSVNAIVRVMGSNTEVRDLQFLHTKRPPVWSEGPGMSIRIQDVWIEGITMQGMNANSGGKIDLRDVLMRGSPPGSDSFLTLCLLNSSGMDLRRVILEYCEDSSLSSHLAEGYMRAEDVVVRGGGEALTVGLDGTFEGARLVFEDNVRVAVKGGPGTLRMSDAIVRDTQADAYAPNVGRPFELHGATAELDRVLVEGGKDLGMMVLGDGTSVRMEDSVIRDMLGGPEDGRVGRGINVQDGARVEVVRSVVEGTHDCGIFLDSTVATIEDTLVRETLPEIPSGRYGRGVNVQTGTELDMVRSTIAGSAEMGLALFDSRARLTDVLVEDTRGQMDGTSGRGLGVHLLSEAEATRVALRSNREAGAYVLQSTLTFEDLAVLEVLPQACATGTCADAAGGMGLISTFTATVEGRRFDIADAAICGLLVDSDASLDVSEGTVRGSAIGACVQVPGFDLSRLSRDVRYIDNGINLDSTELPVPEPAAQQAIGSADMP